jgi:electron transfer flavoprotein beta subunit
LARGAIDASVNRVTWRTPAAATAAPRAKHSAEGEASVKICVLVKEVPDAAVEKRMDDGSKRLDRSGEKNLNPFDTHAIEAAMQIREGGAIEIDEIVAVTMGPESAFRALHKAVSLGADRSVHLTDESLAGSDVCATGYALAKVLESESPDIVLLGQQSDDGECYTIGAVVADHLKMPSLTQVIKMDAADGKLTCERQAEYGYDTVEVELPAVISVGDAINEPRYPSLKAIMGAKKKPLDTNSTGDVGIEADRVGEGGSRTTVLELKPPPQKEAGEIIEDEDTAETVEKIVAWLEERKLI